MDHGQCLIEETLTDYLEGGLDPAIRAASEVHLVGCDDCRRNLAFYIRLLNQEIQPEESAAIETITGIWKQKDLRARVPRRSGTWKGWFLGTVAAAALLIGGIVSIRFIADRAAEPDSAAEIVQLLLDQHRPFELRMSNERHLPMVRTRGTADPGVSYGLLAGEMTRLSADSHQMGRFYLLQKDFDRAIGYLELAAREVGAPADVHNDLGVAYFEAGGESHIQKAAEEFRRASELDPQFAPAIFNLAVFYEREGARSQAEMQWKRYVQLDPNSAWSSEAQTRLETLIRRNGR